MTGRQSLSRKKSSCFAATDSFTAGPAPRKKVHSILVSLAAANSFSTSSRARERPTPGWPKRMVNSSAETEPT